MLCRLSEVNVENKLHDEQVQLYLTRHSKDYKFSKDQSPRQMKFHFQNLELSLQLKHEFH